MGRRSDIDHLGEPWALALPPIPMENGEIRGAIADAQGRLNINALGLAGDSAPERIRLARLFARAGAPDRRRVVADWIDEDAVTREGGAEDAFYLAQPAPISRERTARPGRGVDGGEGMTPAPWRRSLPFVVGAAARDAGQREHGARRSPGAIVDDLTPEAYEALVADRARKPFTTVAEFRARLPSGASSRATRARRREQLLPDHHRSAQGTTARPRPRASARSGGSRPSIVWTSRRVTRRPPEVE
jgi:general secretion pathway protein K